MENTGRTVNRRLPDPDARTHARTVAGTYFMFQAVIIVRRFSSGLSADSARNFR